MNHVVEALEYNIAVAKKRGKDTAELEEALKRALEMPPPPIRKPLPRQPPSDSDSSSDSSASPIVLKVVPMTIEGRTVDVVTIHGMQYAYKTNTQTFLGIVKRKRVDNLLVPTIIKDPKHPDPLQEYEVDD